VRILFLGDVMGKAGREAVARHLPTLKSEHGIDFTVVNGENASHGRGLTEAHFNGLKQAGADAVTLGDHAWDQRETLSFIAREPTLLRPVNMADGTPGRGAMLYEAGERQVLVINALGRVFMDPIDDPFRAVEAAIAECPLGERADAIVVDFHCEATSEIAAMGVFLDGRASLVVGTHTHVPTADARILKGGTGFMSDAGMCGDYDSIIGVDSDEPLNRFLTGVPNERFSPASGEATVCGVVVETGETGLCRSIEPVRAGGILALSGN
jgi:metallophosphoesterase (TIGR00282 family)